jgi:cytidylate kinase
MHFAETFGPTDVLSPTLLLTFEGEARSGKGTSVEAVRWALAERDYDVRVIDQGRKFRTLARLALDSGVALDKPAAVSAFLRDEKTQPGMLELLESLDTMDDAQVKTLLYTQEVGNGSGKIGARPEAHPMVIDLLFKQVKQAVDAKADVVLIDGRCMEKYGRQMAKDKIAQFVLGFYFRCDVAIAARRVTSIITDTSKMTDAEKLRMFDALMGISGRNRDDVLRPTDPMEEPEDALQLHLRRFHGQLHDAEYVRLKTLEALRKGAVSMDTSYTETVGQMTDSVVALAIQALDMQREEMGRFALDPRLWGKPQRYGEPLLRVVG